MITFCPYTSCFIDTKNVAMKTVKVDELESTGGLNLLKLEERRR